MTLPDQLTLARALAVPVVIVLFAWDFEDHLYWATGVFAVAMATDQVDGWLARRRNQTSAFGSLLDPIADKVLVLAALVMLVAEGVAPGWMVAAIVAREIAVSGLRLAAIERGVVIGARDLGKLKTWAQTVAATLAGLQAAGAWERGRRVVGAPRRDPADVDLRAGLRACRPAGAPRRGRGPVGRGRPADHGRPLHRLGEAGTPPAAVGDGPFGDSQARGGRSPRDDVCACGIVGRRNELELHAARLRERHEARRGRLERGHHDVSLAQPEPLERRRADVGHEFADPHSGAVPERRRPR